MIKDLSQIDVNKLKELFTADNEYLQLERMKVLLNNRIDELMIKRPQF
ncbi:MAG: hypothetical protein WCH65_02665 [bacterium]